MTQANNEKQDMQSIKIGGQGSPNEPSVVQTALAFGFMVLPLGERVPEPEGLIAGSGDNRLAIRAHGKV